MNSLVPTINLGLALFAVWESFVLIWKLLPYKIPIFFRPILFIGGGVYLSFQFYESNSWLVLMILGLAAAGIAKLANMFYQLLLTAGEARALDIISHANTRIRADKATLSSVGNRVNLPS